MRNFFASAWAKTTEFCRKAHQSPIITLSGWLIAVLMAVMYFVDRSKTDLAYCESPTRSMLVNSANVVNGLQVHFKGRKVRGGVSSIKFLVWNRGTRAIHINDILIPDAVRITSTPPVGILQANVEKQSRSVIGFGILPPLKTYPDDLPLGWRVLERGDAAIVQVIYEGPHDAKFRIVGSIEGQRVPDRRDYEGLAKETWREFLAALWPAAIFTAQLATTWKKGRKKSWWFAITTVFCVVLLVLLWKPLSEIWGAAPDIRF